MKLNQTQARAFTNFRRSADSVRIREVLEKELGLTRQVSEASPATEFNRAQVVAVKDLIDKLFATPLELLK